MFGFDEKLAVRSSLRFGQNGLVISSVDIQSVEPVDQRTRDALQKSVQLAIEITTNSQEATARSVNTSSCSFVPNIICIYHLVEEKLLAHQATCLYLMLISALCLKIIK